MADNQYNYDVAFSRNLGLVNAEEQRILKDSTVAIAGMGAVGSAHLIMLARMGIGNFHIADFDVYEMHNMNRQFGCYVSTLGQPKTEIMKKLVLDINPTATVKIYAAGLEEATAVDFLTGVDLVVDGLDFFVPNTRDILYRHARARNIPVVVSGPIGCSAILQTFMPQGMSWHQFYAMDMAQNDVDKYILFFIGNAPKATHRSYVDPKSIGLKNKTGPSIALAVQLCSGLVGAEALKLLLKRGKLLAAPYYQQYDAYTYQHIVGKLRWGNRGPVQRLKFMLLRRLYRKSSKS